MDIDRLILAIAQHEDADAATDALTQAGLSVTRISSLGGFLGTHNVTLLIGLSSGDVERAVRLVHAHCHRRTVPVHLAARDAVAHLSVFVPPTVADVGGATVMVLPVARYVRLGADHLIVDSKYQSVEPGTIQLVVSIVSNEQSGRLLERLTDWSYHATLISTTGGFLRRGNATLLIGVRSERVASVVDQIRQVCEMDSTNEPMATIFVLNIARLEHI